LRREGRGGGEEVREEKGGRKETRKQGEKWFAKEGIRRKEYEGRNVKE
jgi:hypothetical protein